jgi:Integrase core domain
VAEAVQEWIRVVGTKTAYIERGSPWENGYVESFNAPSRRTPRRSALTFVRFLSIGFDTAFHGVAPARMSREAT